MMRHKSIQDQLKEIGNRHRVEIFYAFGSRCQEALTCLIKGVSKGVSMDKKSLSDLDIGAKICQNVHLSVRDKAELMVELEDLFQVKRLDLVILNEADPFLAANIIRGERLFCKDEDRADEYELYVLRRAGDLTPLERERLSLIMEEG